jgi:two-component system sensor histidine kinase UhpB
MPPAKVLRCLYLCSNQLFVASVESALQREFDALTLTHTSSMDDFVSKATSGEFDLLMSEYWLESLTGVDAWNSLPHGETELPFLILFTAELGEAESVDVMRSGVTDCIYLEDIQRLGYIVVKLLEAWEARQAKIQADAALVVSRNQLLRLSQEMHSRIEEERAAVSREIHDDIGGALAAVKFDLAWIARRSTDPAVVERVSQSTVTLQQALDASQRIMLSLRPAILDEGLIPALHWLVNAFQKRTGEEVVFRCEKDALCLSSGIQTVAYSVVREALTNVVKHAQASRVVVDVSDHEGVLTVEVTDNGVGLTSKALSKPTSFGILGLRERAQSVGGWLDVSSSGAGVSVILTVPLDGTVFSDDTEPSE